MFLVKPNERELKAFDSLKGNPNIDVLTEYIHRARDKLADEADFAQTTFIVGNCQGGRKALFALLSLLGKGEKK